MVMRIVLEAFSQRATGKANNEDAMLLDGHVHQGRVREHGEVDTSQPHYFAVADGVSSGTLPRTASRRLLELLQTRLATASATVSLSALLHQVQQDYVALSATRTDCFGMASTLVGVRLVGKSATIFNVGDSRAYLLTGGGSKPHAHLLSRDHSFLNELIDDGEITKAQSETAASFMRGLTSHFIADPEFDGFKVNIVNHEMQVGERLLLCSDGLNEVLSDTQIAHLLAGHSADDLLKACKASRRAGGRDDFSVIVLELSDCFFRVTK
jgi:serine/threonine protein phosphatase PrpC